MSSFVTKRSALNHILICRDLLENLLGYTEDENLIEREGLQRLIIKGLSDAYRTYLDLKIKEAEQEDD
jgi:hypothetical protein